MDLVSNSTIYLNQIGLPLRSCAALESRPLASNEVFATKLTMPLHGRASSALKEDGYDHTFRSRKRPLIVTITLAGKQFEQRSAKQSSLV